MQPNGSKRRGFAVGDPARRSRDGDGKIPAPVGPVTVRAVSRSEMEPNGDKRRVVGRGATLERSESGAGQHIGPCGADDRTRGFAAGEMRPNGSKGRGGNGSRVWEKRKASAFAGPITKSADGVTFLMLRK
mgnify:CR=1 FL=1